MMPAKQQNPVVKESALSAWGLTAFAGNISSSVLLIYSNKVLMTGHNFRFGEVGGPPFVKLLVSEHARSTANEICGLQSDKASKILHFLGPIQQHICGVNMHAIQVLQMCTP